jgi:cytochrome c
MVEYVFSVTADKSNPTSQGFANSVAISDVGGSLKLEATYTDLGRGEIPALIGTGSVVLRSRHIQAEAADQVDAAQRLGSSKAEGGHFIGAINHDAFLKFDSIPFDGLKSVTARVASAGAGGMIEIRRGKPDGTMIGSGEVKVNGSWEDFYELDIALEPSTGRDALYLVFKNPKNRGGLMNIDSLKLQ